MHVIVGQDTDSESNALEAGMPWIVKFDKDDFVGKWALEHVRERGLREQLVGFEMANGVVPPEGGAGRRRRQARPAASRAPAGAQAARQGDRPRLGAARARRGGRRISIARGRRAASARSVRLRPFFDPDGERLRS